MNLKNLLDFLMKFLFLIEKQIVVEILCIDLRFILHNDTRRLILYINFHRLLIYGLNMILGHLCDADETALLTSHGFGRL